MSSTADAIEAAILHGVDSHTVSSYREDQRADSSGSAPNTDDELGSDLPSDDDHLYDDDDESRASDARSACAAARSDAIRGTQSSRTANRGEEGATNTGPKGVLRDRQLRAQQESAARSAAIHATNRKMESIAITAESYSEQIARQKREQAAVLERENMDSDDDETASQAAIADLQAKERRREMRIAELKTFHAAKNNALVSGTIHAPTRPASAPTDRYFGHLRQVDERGYVSAIDNEDARVPVVIHIYSKAVAQCNVLTSSLASLARQYPHTKFLQVQAAAIGFGRNADDDQDEEFDEFNSKTLEVLPTVLVYKAGKLVANLVRVDLDPMWNKGSEQDLRDLLDAYGALPTDAEPATAIKATVHANDDDDDE